MSHSVTIIGAGPVGLSAALFLHDRGQRVRVLEKRTEPVKESKALAVNPRTLELLAPSGVTRQILRLGMPIRYANLWNEGGDLLAEIGFGDLTTKFPYMLALSQAVTERLLAEALEARGVAIERGKTVLDVENTGRLARVRVADGDNIDSDFALGADGASSRTRESLGIRFDGGSLGGEWHLADVALETDLAPDRAHVIFRDGGGFFFAVRVVVDRHAEGDSLWRVISSRPRPLLDFPRGRALATPLWESSFQVSHRIGRELGQGTVFLAGDAAHLHSPVGARGMNLGIEDAWVFARLLENGRLDQYASQRRAIDQGVVHRIDILSRLAMGEAATIRALRNTLLPAALRFRFFSRIVKRGLSGLDHKVA